ncbi:MAG: trehalose-phosphatase [Kofleriaceae bacterium]|nr:trehalose-phosphatase [Kofleriaceae bacterium]
MQLAAAPLHDNKRLLALVQHEALTLLLDFDGTLVPFARTAEEATLDPSTEALLVGLRASGANVMIVTGRPQRLVVPFQERCAGIWWAAEHGSWRCDPSGAWEGPPPIGEIDELEKLLAPFLLIGGVRLERKSLSICLHWRECAEVLKAPLIVAATSTCDEWLESHPDFERIEGVEMLEVRRRVANKGSAVAWARRQFAGAKVIAIGDDVTDEDMFAALHDDELAIGVGPRMSTRSAFNVAGPPSVHTLLRWITDVRTSGITRAFVGLAHAAPAPQPKSALVVVSNRLPPTGTGRARPVGGLVSALEPALDAHDGIWLGWSGLDADGDRPLVFDAEDATRAAFDFPRGWREHFYAGFCNRALWPAFHGFPGRVEYIDKDWEAYVAANQEFAARARALALRDGTIWIHDYHLLLMGRALRQGGFTGRIGLFLHIPFPAADIFDTIPWADEIIDALLALDVIGVHTARWANNLRIAFDARARGRSRPEIVVLPIGVDPAHFTGASGSQHVAGLQAVLGPRKLVLGVDRLDYSKGIPARLAAFARMLEVYPELRRRVGFVQISVPSREEVPEYARLREEVEELVGRINGRFGEADWVPVRYLYRSYEREVLAQLYRAADVALVTPLCDGLNLVAKEFVVAQDAAKPGVLVLSKFAGAAAELSDAILTNPYHPDGMARDLHRALAMNLDERVHRHRRLRAALEGNTPQAWASAFLARLREQERSVA